ncbi:MAG: glycine betaine ABC transporter substrate-binding protein [Desulfosarcinaceae bacterium]|nr:glycine betaine ABC transporter substrate-binding protein [Desulfosarcinaceae bacterium]
MPPVPPWHRRRTRLIWLLTLALLIACDTGWLQRTPPELRLHDDQIDALQINNAIAAFIFETGYGYRVERIDLTTKEVQRMLVSGELDITLEAWTTSNHAWLERETARGTIIDLGPMYGEGQEFWMIPSWVAQRYQIDSVADMKDHWRLFQDPEDPTKGVFFNCIIGWTCLEINRIKLEAYGLDKFYNAVSPSSPEALEAAFENAQLKQIPVFGYYWNPNAMMALYQWQILAEPPHSPDVWGEVLAAAEDATLRPLSAACQYEPGSGHKLVHHKLADRAPAILAVLDRLHLDTEILNELLLRSRLSNAESWTDIARYFFREYPKIWHAWVTPSAREKMEQVLGK